MVKVIFYHFFCPLLNFILFLFILKYINILKTNYETKEKQRSY